MNFENKIIFLGLVRGTNHLRHSPIMKAITAKLIIYPWMWIFMKNAMMGAQTMVYLATDPVLKETTGQYFKYIFFFEMKFSKYLFKLFSFK